MQYVFLSHDVDWRRQGPPLSHILARSDRFDRTTLENAGVVNPYYNIPTYIELEDKYHVRSTFFFRTLYENGNLVDYENDIRTLVEGGWEIGLQCDPSSISDIDDISLERTTLQTLTKSEIKGNRVHYLSFDKELPKKLKEIGFVYDSSLKKFKDSINKEDMGHYKLDRITEFPITLMDAYMFTYMKISEDQVINVVKNTLDFGRKFNREFNILTIAWHDNVLKMRGGRMYKSILEFLTTQEDVSICRGIDLVEMINSKNCQSQILPR